MIEAPKKLVEDATKDDSDAKLLQVVHDYLVDMLTNSYCPLAEILFIMTGRLGLAIPLATSRHVLVSHSHGLFSEKRKMRMVY